MRRGSRVSLQPPLPYFPIVCRTGVERCTRTTRNAKSAKRARRARLDSQRRTQPARQPRGTRDSARMTSLSSFVCSADLILMQAFEIPSSSRPKQRRSAGEKHKRPLGVVRLLFFFFVVSRSKLDGSFLRIQAAAWSCQSPPRDGASVARPRVRKVLFRGFAMH